MQTIVVRWWVQVSRLWLANIEGLDLHLYVEVFNVSGGEGACAT
jgi:hypothetical protein